MAILPRTILLFALPLWAQDDMAVIPAGSFTMGRVKSTSDDKTNMRPHVLLDDRPVRAVQMPEFRLDRRETTQADYARFAAATGRAVPRHWPGGKVPAGTEQYPVYNVDWHDAAAYCAWAGKRLPTEAEWERAARGGLEGKDYPNGDKLAAADALFNVQTGPGPVGRFAPNAFGLHDMAGSVAEWTADWFDRDYYGSGEDTNPQGPRTGQYRVIRGGAWSDQARRVTVFYRNWVRDTQKTPNLGFRCAR